MFSTRIWLGGWLLLLACALSVPAQESVGTGTNVVVPPLVKFGGVLSDANGKPLTGMVGVSFYLYKDAQGGAPLWMETQNIQPDPAGRYTATLGSMSGHGLPVDLFASGEARWLGVQAQGQKEQARVMLLSVPYALKAGDAQTVGGLPPSAFVLATPTGASVANTTPPGSARGLPAARPASPPTPCTAVTSDGTATANQVTKFTAPCNIEASAMVETGGNVGIGTSTPAATLDVQNAATTGSTVGVSGQVASAAGTAAVFTNTAGGQILLGKSRGTQVFSVNGNGNVAAASGSFANNLSGRQLISTVAAPTAPLSVKSTAQVANLNASFLGGFGASAFARLAAANIFTANQTVNGGVTATSFFGDGSGLGNVNALFFQGLVPADFIRNGTSPQNANFNITGNGTIGGSLDATGDVTAKDMTVTGDVTADGNVVATGDVSATGNVTGTLVSASTTAVGDLAALSGLALGTSGQTKGVYGETHSPNGIGARFVNFAGGKILTLGVASGDVATFDGLGNETISGKFLASGDITSHGHVFTDAGFHGNCLASTDMFKISSEHGCNQDLAEAYDSVQATEPGDMVSLVPGDEATVRKSAGRYESLLLGVVSSNPGLVFDNGQTHLAGDNSKLVTRDKTVVALAGRVAVKVSMENGAIGVGDPLTSSGRSGVAMRATAAGKIVGYALAPARQDGTVLMFVQPGYYAAPQLALLKSQVAELHHENMKLHQENVRLRSQFAGLAAQVRRIQATVTAGTYDSDTHQHTTSSTNQPAKNSTGGN